MTTTRDIEAYEKRRSELRAKGIKVADRYEVGDDEFDRRELEELEQSLNTADADEGDAWMYPGGRRPN